MTLSFLLRGGEGGHVTVNMGNDLSATIFAVKLRLTPLSSIQHRSYFDEQETQQRQGRHGGR
jgi:hypothetical protein